MTGCPAEKYDRMILLRSPIRSLARVSCRRNEERTVHDVGSKGCGLIGCTRPTDPGCLGNCALGVALPHGLPATAFSSLSAPLSLITLRCHSTSPYTSKAQKHFAASDFYCPLHLHIYSAASFSLSSQDGFPATDKDHPHRSIEDQASSPPGWYERCSWPKARCSRHERRWSGCHWRCKHNRVQRKTGANALQVGYTPDMLREQIAELKGHLTDKNGPFGVDLLLPQVGGSARKTK